jgi:acyl-CoA synthetase (AMP-forming)/AMP-acid ligase II
VLIYTSGTTGPPKGALIPHRALIGNLTGFVCSQNWFRRRTARRRSFLEPGRLGLDRRADGRAAAHAVLRPAHRGLPGALLARAAFELMQRTA